MKFSKIFKDQLDHCYAIMRMNAKGRDFLVVASEEAQPCYAMHMIWTMILHELQYGQM